MLSTIDKQFYSAIAWGACRQSDCSEGKGAVLVRGSKVISIGHSRRILKDKWEISAIFDAIFGSRDTDITGTILFSTYFPQIEDIKLITISGIKTVYFFGGQNDAQTVEFLHSLNEKTEIVEMLNLNLA